MFKVKQILKIIKLQYSYHTQDIMDNYFHNKDIQQDFKNNIKQISLPYDKYFNSIGNEIRI